VHRRHIESMPELAPYLDDQEIWTCRRALYLELMASAETVLLLACLDGNLVGYGLAHVMNVDKT
jgi:hypothetical protein